ncbi:MAG: glycosyl hydrolase family 18 protein [Micromonosporaceae bacterium]
MSRLAAADELDRSHRPPRLPRLLSSAAWLAVVAAGALFVALITVIPSSTSGRPSAVVVASLPYWNISNGTSTVLANRHDFNEVSPWMYGLDNTGHIVLQYNSGDAAAVGACLRRLRAARLPIVPTLANVIRGRFAYQPVASILHNRSLMNQHVAAIAALVQQQHYAGIDIDYENLQAADRQVFTDFVTRLGVALHAKGKILSVAVFAKTTNAGYDPRDVAQNYRAIGRAADEIRLMAYDFHWETSGPGPIAPITWIQAVLRYAKSQIPIKKIILGVPLYGYDWVGNHGTPVTWLRVFQLATSYEAQPRYDTSSQSPWFTYTDNSGRKHEVWFENAESTKAKLGAARGSGIGGAYLWMYGNAETSTWSALHQALPSSAQAPARMRPTAR